MNKIENYDCYLTRMSKTFFDKAWFMSHLPENILFIVDYGCADGSFMEFLKRNCPCYVYIGIDNDSEMQKLTKEKGFPCFSSLKEAHEQYGFFPEKTCLVLNSVIHEIWSYYQDASFLEDLHDIYPKYIAIRDMMFNPIDRTRFYLPEYDHYRIMNALQSVSWNKFNDFMEVWKEQDKEIQPAHFLLKYFYDENWKREVKENYFPIDIKELRNTVCNGYNIEFQSFYKLPYLVNKWKNDFELNKNFELNEFIRNINTHYKLLLKTN